MRHLISFIAGAAIAAIVVVLLWPGSAAKPSLPIRDGLLDFRVVSAVADIASITGTHAEMPARGRFTHIRLSVTNGDATFHEYTAAKQLLVTNDGHRLAPDHDAMLVKRQSDTVELGGHSEAQVELWYDVPLGSSPLSLVVQDDEDGGPGHSVPLDFSGERFPRDLAARARAASSATGHPRPWWIGNPARFLSAGARPQQADLDW